MSDLLPCPLCGGKAELYQGTPRYGRFWWRAECPSCEIWISDREKFDGEGMLVYPEKECLTRWNTRSDKAAARALLDLDEAPSVFSNRGRLGMEIYDEVRSEGGTREVAFNFAFRAMLAAIAEVDDAHVHGP